MGVIPAGVQPTSYLALAANPVARGIRDLIDVELASDHLVRIVIWWREKEPMVEECA